MGRRPAGLLVTAVLFLLRPGAAAAQHPSCGGGGVRQLQDMSRALLQAHRCMIRDEPVPVPVPDNTIPDSVHPSHIVVPRCTGLCLESLGSSCKPRKTIKKVHEMVVYVNSTPYCTKIELEHHRGPCRCVCHQSPASCSSKQLFHTPSCSCQCHASLGREKAECSNSSLHQWDPDACRCTCRQPDKGCIQGYAMDALTCQCKKVEPINCPFQKRDLPETSTSSVMYVGLCLAVSLGCVVTAALCWMVTKRRLYEDLVVIPEAASPQLGATSPYTIKFRQSSLHLEQSVNQ